MGTNVKEQPFAQEILDITAKVRQQQFLESILPPPSQRKVSTVTQKDAAQDSLSDFERGMLSVISDNMDGYLGSAIRKDVHRVLSGLRNKIRRVARAGDQKIVAGFIDEIPECLSDVYDVALVQQNLDPQEPVWRNLNFMKWLFENLRFIYSNPDELFHHVNQIIGYNLILSSVNHYAKNLGLETAFVRIFEDGKFSIILVVYW